MASCLNEHKYLDPITKIGKCSVPTWVKTEYGRAPDWFCEKPAYGYPTAAGRKRYSEYVPYLACPEHGGPQPVKNDFTDDIVLID